MLLAGYTGIRAFYDHADSITPLSTTMLVILITCSFLTGFGGNGGLTGSMNANAKSWPDKRVRPYHLLSTFSLIVEKARDDKRNRDIRLWPIGVLLLHHRTSFLQRRHLFPPPPSSPRNSSTDDYRFHIR